VVRQGCWGEGARDMQAVRTKGKVLVSINKGLEAKVRETHLSMWHQLPAFLKWVCKSSPHAQEVP
jgi:hypothetical protein